MLSHYILEKVVLQNEEEVEVEESSGNDEDEEKKEEKKEEPKPDEGTNTDTEIRDMDFAELEHLTYLYVQYRTNSAGKDKEQVQSEVKPKEEQIDEVLLTSGGEKDVDPD